MTFDVRRREAAAEVARGRRIGNAAGPDGIKEVDVVATHFDIFEVAAVAQRVVSDVENVIGLVIGEMDLEKLQSLINSVDESKLTGEGVHGADAAVDDATSTIRDLIVDVVGGKHRLVTTSELALVEAALDAALAVGQITVYSRVHSKPLRASGVGELRSSY